MCNLLKAMLAIACIGLTSAAWAQSNPLSLGSVSSGDIEVEVIAETYNVISIYQDNNLVFSYDSGGVLYAASGVYWTTMGGFGREYYFVSGLPSGNYTATLTVSGPTYLYSVDSTNLGISWHQGNVDVWAYFRNIY